MCRTQNVTLYRHLAICIFVFVYLVQKMYALVLFVNSDPGQDDEVEVVPKSWISADGRKCSWPDTSSIPKSGLGKAIENGMPPEHDWPLFDVRVLKETGK